MLVFRRLRNGSATVLTAVTAIACSSSSGESTESSPTLVTVSPSTFGQGVVCGTFPGAWKTYVATLTDVDDPDLVIASSNPVVCSMPVSFAWIIPGHDYTAHVAGYDRNDLVPVGGFSSGSPTLVDPNTGEEVLPRWETSCGVAEQGGTPTRSYLQTNMIVRGCQPLQEVRPADHDTGALLDLSAVRGNLKCGNETGQIDRLRVSYDANQAPTQAVCDEILTFSSLVADQNYEFRIEAFDSSHVAPTWATTCRLQTQMGVTLPAVCDTLSDRGALRVNIASLLESISLTCNDISTYRAVVLGSTQAGSLSDCLSDSVFSALPPSVYQVSVEGYDNAGHERFNALCEGAVKSAATTDVICQATANETAETSIGLELPSPAIPFARGYRE